MPLYCSCLQCFDTVGWAAGRASTTKVTTLWRYTNLFIIIVYYYYSKITELWGDGMVICLE